MITFTVPGDAFIAMGARELSRREAVFKWREISA